MTFDWTFNFSHIFSVILALGMVIGLYYGMRFEIKMMSREFKAGSDLMTEKLGHVGGRVINIETELRELRIVASNIAITEQKITNLGGQIVEHSRRLNVIDSRLNHIKPRTNE